MPGESHGWRSLVDYSPWGCEESDFTSLHFLLEYRLALHDRNTHTHTHTHTYVNIYIYLWGWGRERSERGREMNFVLKEILSSKTREMNFVLKEIC